MIFKKNRKYPSVKLTTKIVLLPPNRKQSTSIYRTLATKSVYISIRLSGLDNSLHFDFRRSFVRTKVPASAKKSHETEHSSHFLVLILGSGIFVERLEILKFFAIFERYVL